MILLDCLKLFRDHNCRQKISRIIFWDTPLEIVLAIGEFIIATTTLLVCRNILGYMFSNEEEVVNYLKELSPLLCLLLIMDSIQAVLSGVARGSGWQHLGAYVNLGAYYIVGMPVAVVLGFVWHLGGKGLWLGLNAGSTVQCFLLAAITCFTNWEKQVLTIHSTFDMISFSKVYLR